MKEHAQVSLPKGTQHAESCYGLCRCLCCMHTACNLTLLVWCLKVPFLGQRPVAGNGTPGPYEWMTYAEVITQAHHCPPALAVA